MKLDRTQLEQVAELFRAFAEPTRLAILQELKSEELSVGRIVAQVDSSQANVSKQLKILHQAGLVRRRKQNTQVLYSVDDAMVFEMCRLVCDKISQSAAAKTTLNF